MCACISFKDYPVFFAIEDNRGYTALDYAKWRVEHDQHDYMLNVVKTLGHVWTKKNILTDTLAGFLDWNVLEAFFGHCNTIA